MARLLYGATSGDYTMTGGGRVIPNAPVEIWDAIEGGSQITDLTDYDGNPCAVVTSGADGLVRFYGPDGENDNLWMDTRQGSRLLVRPTVLTSTIADGSILDEDIAADADIARTKIAGTALTADSMGVFNVLDYGAAGDGVTDDTAHIQAAITAAVAVGGTVLVPSGTYKITDALTVTGAATITGTGTIHQVTSGKHGFNVSASGVTIDGLTLTGCNTTAVYTYSENAVHAFGPSAAAAISNLTFRDLTISGWGDYGVQLKWVTDYQVVGCTITNVGYAGVSTLSALRGVIADNRIDSIEPGFVGDCYGIALSRWEVDSLVTDPLSSDAVIRGNIISNISWEGIDTHGGQRITIANNVLLDCGRAIAIVGQDASGQVTTWAAKDVAVTGNVIDSLHTDGSIEAGITFAGAPGATGSDPAVDYATGVIANNVIRGHGNQDSGIIGAIQCRNTKGLVISGNVIEEPSPYGVHMHYDNLGFVVTGNTIVDAWSTDLAQPAAIALRSANNKGLVAGNVLRRGTKTATYVNVFGFLNSPGAAGGTDVNYGANDFASATYQVDPSGISLRLTAPLDNTGQIRAAGDVSSPGFSFTDDPDSGFYHYADGQIGLSINGSRDVMFYPNGIQLEDGTNIDVGTTSGTYVGVAANRKLGFWGATPVVQPAANADTSGASLGDLETEVNQLKALLRSIGLMAS